MTQGKDAPKKKRGDASTQTPVPLVPFSPPENPEAFKLLRPGTPIKIKGTDLVGTVLAAMIEVKMAVSYKIAYWFNGDRKEIWLPENEIEEKIAAKIPMGFHASFESAS